MLIYENHLTHLPIELATLVSHIKSTFKNLNNFANITE